MFTRILLTATVGLLACPQAQSQDRVVMEGRYRVFNDFHIQGAGGTDFMELAAKYGANTIRTWKVGEETATCLNDAQRLDLKMILGIWMPHQGANGSVGSSYQFDYQKSRLKVLKKLQKTLDQFDSHPSVLMWGLGNEVHLEPEYLTVVNEMAQIVHRHNPDRLTCIVIINAPEKSIDLIKKYAPEVDMIGVNSYGLGAMRTCIKNLETHWGKPYFFSEYAHKGPWSAPKSKTGHRLEFTPAEKVKQLSEAWPATTEGEHNTGGVVFVWDQFSKHMQTWFSLLLTSDAAKKTLDPGDVPLITPMADQMHLHWHGEPVGNHAPVITEMKINDTHRGLTVTGNQTMKVAVTAADRENDRLSYRYWIFQMAGEQRQSTVMGPMKGSCHVEIASPGNTGDYRLLCMVSDGHGKASTHHLPFHVDGTEPIAKVPSEKTLASKSQLKQTSAIKPAADQVFANRDRNQDQELTKIEFMAKAPPTQQHDASRRFDWTDKNADGVVSIDEHIATWGKPLPVSLDGKTPVKH